MIPIVLLAIAIGLPTIAVITEFVFSTRLTERHHRHHDTYSVSIIMLSTVVMAMLFMGLLGVLLFWLCHVGVFKAEANVILGFFSSFVLVMFVMWLAMRRYHVSTYDEYMEITPFVGRTCTVRYDQIERLHWSGSRSPYSGRSLSVVVGERVVAVLVGLVDVDQIVQRINRQDLMEE